MLEKKKNYGIELTIERFLNRGFYCMLSNSLFLSKFKGSDNIWYHTAIKSNFVINELAGKEIKITRKSVFGIDTKFTIRGGRRYTPFDIEASKVAGYVIYLENIAYSKQKNTYFCRDLKFSFALNIRKTTQRLYLGGKI